MSDSYTEEYADKLLFKARELLEVVTSSVRPSVMGKRQNFVSAINKEIVSLVSIKNKYFGDSV